MGYGQVGDAMGEVKGESCGFPREEVVYCLDTNHIKGDGDVTMVKTRVNDLEFSVERKAKIVEFVVCSK